MKRKISVNKFYIALYKALKNLYSSKKQFETFHLCPGESIKEESFSTFWLFEVQGIHKKHLKELNNQSDNHSFHSTAEATRHDRASTHYIAI